MNHKENEHKPTFEEKVAEITSYMDEKWFREFNLSGVFSNGSKPNPLELLNTTTPILERNFPRFIAELRERKNGGVSVYIIKQQLKE